MTFPAMTVPKLGTMPSAGTPDDTMNVTSTVAFEGGVAGEN
jgi:hypothetical protein